MADVQQTTQGQTQGGGDGGASAATGTEAQGGNQTTQKPWYDTYPEDLREGLKSYDKPETLAKAHLELKKKYDVPEDPNGYEFDAKTMDDMQKKALDDFRKEAKELGLSKSQFKTMVEKAMAQNKAFWERRRAEEKAAKDKQDAEFKKSVDELKTEWGNKFEDNIKSAQKTVDKVFPASFKNFLNDSGLGNHPEMVRAMVRLAETIGEDGLVRNASKQQPSNRDPQTGEPMLKFTSMK